MTRTRHWVEALVLPFVAFALAMHDALRPPKTWYVQLRDDESFRETYIDRDLARWHRLGDA